MISLYGLDREYLAYKNEYAQIFHSVMGTGTMLNGPSVVMLEAELEKIQTHEGSQKKPVFMDEKGIAAAVYPQGHAEQDEKSGNGMDPVCYDHKYCPPRQVLKKTLQHG
ncbi:MAG: hypothetical protein KKH60_07900 [Proteobacteria bacterium]|nr:hypothetical protein [Pseudomonadota bacterium]